MNDWIEKVDFEKISPDCRCDFEGFVSIKELAKSKCAEVPEKPGVYLILTSNTQLPDFNKEYPGFSKCTLAPRPLKQLETQWNTSPVVYIGKAGGSRNSSNLRKRLNQYFDWFSGKWSNHKGGRDIWQINNPSDLLVAWRVTEEEPRSCEAKLIKKFKREYHKRPFANHQG